MSEREFEFISPRAFYNKMKGFNQVRQAEFELVRLQTVELLNIQIEKKKQIKQPQRLWWFPWEKEKGKPSQEQAAEFKKRVEHGNTYVDRGINI